MLFKKVSRLIVARMVGLLSIVAVLQLLCIGTAVAFPPAPYMMSHTTSKKQCDKLASGAMGLKVKGLKVKKSKNRKY